MRKTCRDWFACFFLTSGSYAKQNKYDTSHFCTFRKLQEPNNCESLHESGWIGMQIGFVFIRKCGWNYRNMDVVMCSCENESTFGQSRSTKWNLLDSFMTKFCSFGCNNSTFKGLFFVFSCSKRSNPSFWAEFWQEGIHLTTLKAFHNPKYLFFFSQKDMNYCT